jgi:signal transduction histidine kinase
MSILTAIIFIFIAGIVLFVNQYRNRQKKNEHEKATIEKQHTLDLLNNQLKVQQQTMLYIGCEIHDSVAQKLTLATLYSRKMEYEHTSPEIAEKQQQISSIINDSLEELKELSRSLSNNTIQDKELRDLINMECKKITASGVCRVDSEMNYTRPLPFIIKSSVLRVIQEFIQNSLKYSGCTLIKINIHEKKDSLFVQLTDNGKGFDSTLLQSNGIGINNMKRRIQMIGGTIDLTSQPGLGTTLEFVIDHKHLLL